MPAPSQQLNDTSMLEQHQFFLFVGVAMVDLQHAPQFFYANRHDIFISSGLIGMPIGMTFSFPVGLKSIIARLRLALTLDGMHHGTMAFTSGMLCVLHCTGRAGVKLEGNRLPCQPSRQPFGETRVGGGASSVEC